MQPPKLKSLTNFCLICIPILFGIFMLNNISYRQPYPDSFVAMQTRYWNPLIDWMNSTYGLEMKTTDGMLSIKQPESVVLGLRNVVEQFDNLKLAGNEITKV